MSTPKPHVSMALSQLRSRVAVAAGVVAVCAAVQLMVFGFTHFTNVRWEQSKPQDLVQELSVVPAAGAEAPRAGADTGGRRAMKLSDFEAAQTARIPSRWNGMLTQFSALAGVGGVVGAFTVAVLTLLGVVIAGGAVVPGVERTVSAATWGLVLGLGCLPWSDLMPSITYSGVFGGYGELVAASEAVQAGLGDPTSFYAGYLLLPTTAIAVSLLVWFQFREGVDRGIILTAPSELDIAVEREMEKVRSRGVSTHVGPRSTGALNLAIGERPVVPSAPPLAVAAGGERPRVLATDRRIGDADPGDPLKRPI
jgi:hypothetical protein